MRFPWQRRADEAEARARDARDGLDKVKDQWEHVHAVAGETRAQREANGFTNVVTSIFAGRPGEGYHRA